MTHMHDDSIMINITCININTEWILFNYYYKNLGNTVLLENVPLNHKLS